MRLLVTGGRDYCDRACVAALMGQALAKYGKANLVVIHGEANGLDSLVSDWCDKNAVVQNGYPADWDKHGKAAGILRNQQMLADGRPDACLSFPGGRGTADMVQRCVNAGIPVGAPAYTIKWWVNQ